MLQKAGQVTIKVLGSVQLSSDLRHHVLVKIPDRYRNTTCGLCGNYNANPSDDLQLPNSTLTLDPHIFGSSWRLTDAGSSCSDECDGTCQLCPSPVPKYTSDLYCGLLTLPTGPFSPCHHVVRPQRYYSFCMTDLCITEGWSQALCDALQAYEVVCQEAGVKVGHWRNTTGCGKSALGVLLII